MFERLRAAFRPAAPELPLPPMAETTWTDINDPRFREWLRGQIYGDGEGVSVDAAMRYSGVARCVDLLRGVMAMLPMRVVDESSGNPVVLPDHPVTRLLGIRPSSWMSAHRFKGIMQWNVLTQPKGAVARIVWSGQRPAGIIPLAPAQVRIEQNHYGPTRYFMLTERDGEQEMDPREVLHLRDLDMADARGLSRVQMAGDAVNLALAAQSLAMAMFRNGIRPGGTLEHPKQLSKEARERLRKLLLAARGSDAASRWMLLEEGLQLKPFQQTAVDPQTEAQRRLQIEESARFFGIPRPLMMMDDTSWGSGVEQLAHLFVRFCLQYWFSCWEDSCTLALLSEAEVRRGLRVDVDEAELLRGTMKDLGTFLAKALGAGGQKPFMTPNEARGWLALGEHPDGDGLEPVTGSATAFDEEDRQSEEQNA